MISLVLDCSPENCTVYTNMGLEGTSRTGKCSSCRPWQLGLWAVSSTARLRFTQVAWTDWGTAEKPGQSLFEPMTFWWMYHRKDEFSMSFVCWDPITPPGEAVLSTSQGRDRNSCERGDMSPPWTFISCFLVFSCQGEHHGLE